MNKTNLILLSVNLLLLGVMLGVGMMVAPRLMHGQCGLERGGPGGPPPEGPQAMMPPHRMLEKQFGPDFNHALAGKIEAKEPGWSDKLKAAKANLQQAIVAEPFNADAFNAASSEFDRLMDSFHATMRDDIHERIEAAPLAERQAIARTLESMPLPLQDRPQGMRPDRGPPPPR